jgi:hypothetical protein
MATYHAVAATGEAILGVLKAACPRSDFEAADFKLYNSGDFQNTPMSEGISLYLYRISINTDNRNLPPRMDSDGKRYRPSLPVDLHYLLIPWAQTSVKQQWLIAWAMRTLENIPILSAEIMNYYATTGAPGESVFHPNETVELVCEPISLQEIVNIWDAFKPNLQLSVAYVARMILLDSEIPLWEGEIVQTRVFDYLERKPENGR